MLIKLYTTSRKLHLIADVKNVISHLKMYNIKSPEDLRKKECVPTPFLHAHFLGDEELCFGKEHGSNMKFIDYTDSNDVNHRMTVDGYAYICTDDGKTLEKVTM